MMDQKMLYCYFNILLRHRMSKIEFTIDCEKEFCKLLLYSLCILGTFIPLTIDYKPYPIISAIA